MTSRHDGLWQAESRSSTRMIAVGSQLRRVRLAQVASRLDEASLSPGELPWPTWYVTRVANRRGLDATVKQR